MSNGHHHDNRHSDESEVFKRKSLSSQKNRKKMAKILQWVLYVVAILVVAACVFTFFVGTI